MSDTTTADSLSNQPLGLGCNEQLGAGAEARYCYSTNEEEYYGDFATREDALATDPHAEPVPGSLEQRRVPDGVAEHQHTSGQRVTST